MTWSVVHRSNASNMTVAGGSVDSAVPSDVASRIAATFSWRKWRHCWAELLKGSSLGVCQTGLDLGWSCRYATGSLAGQHLTQFLLTSRLVPSANRRGAIVVPTPPMLIGLWLTECRYRRSSWRDRRRSRRHSSTIHGDNLWHRFLIFHTGANLSASNPSTPWYNSK